YYTGGFPQGGHPNNAYGSAVGGAFSINLPSFGATSNVNSQPNVDQLRFSASYTVGAVGYATNANGGSLLGHGKTSLGLANLFDGAYLSNPDVTQVKLTTAWSVYGGYQHLWTPNWRTSVYGGYLKVDPDGAIQASACSSPAFNLGNCMSWSTWQVG